MAGRFTANPNLEHDVQPMLVDDLDAITKRLASDAATLARSEVYGAGVGGHYAAMIRGHAELENGVAVGHLMAEKYTSGWIEAGTRFMTGHRILQRTANRSGLRKGRRTSRGYRGG